MPKSLIQTAFVALAMFSTLNASAQQFTLSGILSGTPDGPAMLSYHDDDGNYHRDSSVIQNGSFTFKGSVNNVTEAYLSLNPSSAKYRGGYNGVIVFLEPGSAIMATGKYDNLTGMQFSGSRLQAEANAYNGMRAEVDGLNQPLIDRTIHERAKLLALMAVKAPRHKQDSVNVIYSDLLEQHSTARFKALKKFIAENPDATVSALELYSYKIDLGLPATKRLYGLLTPQVQSQKYGKLVGDYLSALAENGAGKEAKAFTAVDVNGKSISLADFKGKYVILDFWGSWCVPCRDAVPHLKELYSKYHAAGLDVLAIAVDDKPEAWKKAIETDGTGLWYNIMQDPDVKNKPTQINTRYDVHLFPTKILVGKDGVIIDRYVDDVSLLDKKLAELFK